MKLTDKELNFVLSECVKQMLNEYDTVGPLNKTAQYQQKNNYSINTDGVKPVAGVNFMDNTWDGTIYNYPDEYDTKAKISKHKENVNQIEEGIKKTNGKYEVITDRVEAIEKASGQYGRFDDAVKKIDPRKE